MVPAVGYLDRSRVEDRHPHVRTDLHVVVEVLVDVVRLRGCRFARHGQPVLAVVLPRRHPAGLVTVAVRSRFGGRAADRRGPVAVYLVVGVEEQPEAEYGDGQPCQDEDPLEQERTRRQGGPSAAAGRPRVPHPRFHRRPHDRAAPRAPPRCPAGMIPGPPVDGEQPGALVTQLWKSRVTGDACRSVPCRDGGLGIAGPAEPGVPVPAPPPVHHSTKSINCPTISEQPRRPRGVEGRRRRLSTPWGRRGGVPRK